MISIHTTLVKCKTTTTASYFKLMFEENSRREIALLSRCYNFGIPVAPFRIVFLSMLKGKVKCLQFEEQL